MLALFINRAKAVDQLSGVVPHLIDGDLSILQYADDTILFMDHNLEHAHNMKTILCAFEQLLGLKINFHKSEIFFFGEVKNYESQYMELFGCNPGTFPILLYIFAPPSADVCSCPHGGINVFFHRRRQFNFLLSFFILY